LKSRCWRGVLDTTLCDQVCQRLATGLWFSRGTPVSSTYITDKIVESGVKDHNPNPNAHHVNQGNSKPTSYFLAHLTQIVTTERLSSVRPLTFHILISSSEATGPILTKLWWNGPWMAPFQNCVR